MAGQTIVISVLADTKKLAGGLKEAGGMLGGLGSLAKTGAKIAVGALAAVGAAAGAIGFKAVGSASELEQSLGAMSSVFKDSAAQMEGLATAAASSVGLAKSEYAGLATVLGSQLKNMGVSQDALSGQTDKLIGLGADLAAQFGGSTSDAVGALSSLLRGERDPIERYGVSINQAAIDAKLAEMGLAGLSGEAEKNAKLTATLALLYAQTADAQGAFSRESTTLAGAQQRLAAGSENLFATLGTSLLPAVTAVTAALGALITRVQESAAFQALTGWLTDASNAFADFTFNLINGTDGLDFSGLFAGLLPAVVNGIQSAATWLSNGGLAAIFTTIANAREGVLSAALQAFPGIVDALVQVAPMVIASLGVLVNQLVQFLSANATSLLAAAVTMLSSLITGVAAILPGLITAIVGMLPGLINAVLGMIPAILDAAILLFQTIVNAIPVILPGIIAALVAILPTLIESILGMIPAILDGAIALFTSIVEAIPIILPALITALITLVPKILSTVLGMLPKLLEAAVRLFTGIVEAIPKIIPKLIPAILDLLPKMIGALVGMIPTLISAGVNLIGGLVKGLMQAAGSVGKALLDIAKNAVTGFLGFLGIHSPSRLFAGYGKFLIQGLVTGIDGNKKLVSRSLDSLAATVGSFNAPPLNITPAGALTAPTATSSYRAPTATAQTPSMVELSPYDRNLLAEIADRVGITISGQTLQAVVNGSNANMAQRRRA